MRSVAVGEGQARTGAPTKSQSRLGFVAQTCFVLLRLCLLFFLTELERDLEFDDRNLIPLKNKKELYLASFGRLEAPSMSMRRPGCPSFAAAAIGSFAELGFPRLTTRSGSTPTSRRWPPRRLSRRTSS
jgi:hypothetical protein